MALVDVWHRQFRIDTHPLSREDHGSIEVWFRIVGEEVFEKDPVTDEATSYIDGPVVEVEIRSPVGKGGRVYILAAPGKSEKAGDRIEVEDFKPIDLEIATGVDSTIFAIPEGLQFNHALDTWDAACQWPSYIETGEDRVTDPIEPKPRNEDPRPGRVPPRGPL